MHFCALQLANVLSNEALFYVCIIPFIAFFGSFAFIMYPLRDQLHPTGAAAAPGSSMCMIDQMSTCLQTDTLAKLLLLAGACHMTARVLPPRVVLSLQASSSSPAFLADSP